MQALSIKLYHVTLNFECMSDGYWSFCFKALTMLNLKTHSSYAHKVPSIAKNNNNKKKKLPPDIYCNGIQFKDI